MIDDSLQNIQRVVLTSKQREKLTQSKRKYIELQYDTSH